MMEIELFGLHADLNVRSRVAWSESSVTALYEQLDQPCVILVTCHRFEIYTTKKIDANRILDRYEGQAVEVYTKQGNEAVRHLLEVVNGLHSQIFGEDEILRQVKQAYATSVRMDRCDSKLHRLFQLALRCGKEARSRFRMSEHPLSIAYLARQTMGDLRGKSVLLIGSGEISRRLLGYLKDEPCTIYIASRHQKHANALRAIAPQAKVIPFANRVATARRCDLVCCATAAPHLVLPVFLNEKPLALYDFASPRDIDPAFATQKDVTLYTLDTFAALSKANEAIRKEALEDIRALIERDVKEWDAQNASGMQAQTLRALHVQIDEISGQTFSSLEQKIDLTDREKAVLKKSLRASMLRLLHTPIHEIGTHYDDLEPATVQRLFAVETDKERNEDECI